MKIFIQIVELKMVNKCVCGKNPSFNYSGQRTGIACSKCKKEGMVDVVHHQCPCGTRASYNFPEQKKPVSCSKCKKKIAENKGRCYHCGKCEDCLGLSEGSELNRGTKK